MPRAAMRRRVLDRRRRRARADAGDAPVRAAAHAGARARRRALLVLRPRALPSGHPAARVAARLPDRRAEHAVRRAGAHAARHRRRGEGSRARRGVHDDVRAAHDAPVHRVVAGEHRAARRDPARPRPDRRSARRLAGGARRARRAHAGGGVDLRARCTATSRPASRRACSCSTSSRRARSRRRSRRCATRSSIINPSSNPDGHERFTVWYNSVSVGATRPARAWSTTSRGAIQGRFNHYRFDMNRDVIASHAARGAGRSMRDDAAWHPMVAVDQHGHVADVLLPARRAPGERATSARDAGEVARRSSAAPTRPAFDRYGWMYYSRDVFDLYYPGY